MAFKHKDHKHDTVAQARACEESIFVLCEHGMSADLCKGPQHYPLDADEVASGMFPPATTTVNMFNYGGCEGGRCSWYDKCSKHRRQDYQHSGNWRDLFRAYND